MMRRTKTVRRKKGQQTITELRLLGIPHYFQGEADGLCLYYGMSMMLAALHPEYQSQIHEPPRYKRLGSPAFQALRTLVSREREFKKRVADWFFDGLRATEATRLLNRLFEHVSPHGFSGAVFVRRDVRARRLRKLKYARRKSSVLRAWTVKQVFESLDRHLPVLVSGGWLGSHAALIVGYQHGGVDGRWVCVQDPALVRQEWLDCRDIFVDDAEIIVPRQDAYFQRRPPALVKQGTKSTVRDWSVADSAPGRPSPAGC
jgi:Papain-like cysteine protease AvrRpt2